MRLLKQVSREIVLLRDSDIKGDDKKCDRSTKPDKNVYGKTVLEGVDLLPEGVQYEEFNTEYLRELTIPKTLVNETIQVNWIEDGQLKTLSS